MFGRIDSFLSNGWKITAFNGEEGLYFVRTIYSSRFTRDAKRVSVSLRSSSISIFPRIKKGIALWCLSPRQTTCAFRVYSRRSCLPDRESYKFSWSSRVTSTSNDERWILHLDHLPRHRYETNEKTACRVTESDSREINADGKGKFGFLIYFCRFLEREEFLYFLD